MTKFYSTPSGVPWRAYRGPQHQGHADKLAADWWVRALTATSSSVHQHVAELPRISAVDHFRKQVISTAKRRPIGIVPDHRPKIRPLNREAAAEVHLIRLDDAAIGIFQHPYDAGEHRRSHLQTGGVLIGRELSRVLDRKLGPVPVGILGVAIEQDPKLIDAIDDVVFAQDVPSLLRPPRGTRHFVQRQHGIVAWVIGIVAGWPIDEIAVLEQREVVGY